MAGYYHYPGLYGVDFEIADVLTEATTGANKVPTLAGIKFIDQDMKALSLAKAVANPWSADNAPFGIFVQSDYCLAAIPFGANGSPVITFQSPILHAIRDAYVGHRGCHWVVMLDSITDEKSIALFFLPGTPTPPPAAAAPRCRPRSRARRPRSTACTCSTTSCTCTAARPRHARFSSTWSGLIWDPRARR